MSTETNIPFNVRPDAFAGTARSYLKFRPPYPAVMLDDLRKRANVSGSGRLLDLGCGPGRVALPLARHVRAVVAVDLEPEMIEVGKEEAARLGMTNVEWRVGRAEEVNAPAGEFDLITMGESFHRFNQPVILGKVLGWLRPGGCLAGMGCRNVWNGSEPWHDVLRAVRDRWKPGPAASGHPSVPKHELRYGQIMSEAGFEDLGDHEFRIPHIWTVESLIGNAYSSSVMSKQALGARAARFEEDLRQSLLAFDPSNRYPEILEFSYTLARKRG